MIGAEFAEEKKLLYKAMKHGGRLFTQTLLQTPLWLQVPK